MTDGKLFATAIVISIIVGFGLAIRAAVLEFREADEADSFRLKAQREFHDILNTTLEEFNPTIKVSYWKSNKIGGSLLAEVTVNGKLAWIEASTNPDDMKRLANKLAFEYRKQQLMGWIPETSIYIYSPTTRAQI